MLDEKSFCHSEGLPKILDTVVHLLYIEHIQTMASYLSIKIHMASIPLLTNAQICIKRTIKHYGTHIV